ncbi:uncharacterized protein PGTG_18864 [Puccinia graminis f. sp. tritici CRL 75-36-700-3]|uniref:Protein kinase domain-containing protein n=1 Tax=Puccinia graminis f. sp. tritici (strain CRL 75-36-700-3 / race SCCL) TaxID=418459 RepID=E3L8Z8_PUCGT|nr:uncharacterized protein PGTG_18864 [Puccinia graminis f. sp. tritici CRL 75-36-700-3]EFP93023.1 hypothetical protein PGTG_18864 [Puccinia graminis f. sp. tritici CRL 75-36-700-3]
MTTDEVFVFYNCEDMQKHKPHIHAPCSWESMKYCIIEGCFVACMGILVTCFIQKTVFHFVIFLDHLARFTPRVPGGTSLKKGVPANTPKMDVDIWIVGVILYALLIGKPLFQTKDINQFY